MMFIRNKYRNFRIWLAAKIWYWKALREVKKRYPKGTHMRQMMIYNELYYMDMARQEEETLKIWGNKKQNREPIKKHDSGLIY